MNIFELSAELDKLIPPALREEWDNDGLMVAPDGERAIEKAVIALDATCKAIAFAAENGADVIITHHPLIFHRAGSVRVDDSVGMRVVACVKAGIAVASYHTRFDSLPGGVNDALASSLGLRDCVPFLPFGRVGTLDNPMSFGEFACFCETALGESPCASVNAGRPVRRVAAVSGGGKEFVREALDCGADTYVTGEASHDALIDAAGYGLNMLCMTHHATERIALPALAEIVKKAADGKIETLIFDFDRVKEYGI